MVRRLARALVALVPLLAAVGCGAGFANVSGSVTYNGKPVKTGSVTLRAADGSVYSGTITEGNYAIPNVPAGPVTAAVVSPDPTTAPAAATTSAGPSRGAPPPPPKSPPKKPEGWFAIPAKFANPEGSGLSTTLKAGDAKFDLPLKD